VSKNTGVGLEFSKFGFQNTIIGRSYPATVYDEDAADVGDAAGKIESGVGGVQHQSLGL
jgi:hypothetical protein